MLMKNILGVADQSSNVDDGTLFHKNLAEKGTGLNEVVHVAELRNAVFKEHRTVKRRFLNFRSSHFQITMSNIYTICASRMTEIEHISS